MLSVCSSIYRETESLEIFVRSVLGNASDPSQVEVVIVNDEGYGPTTEVLAVLAGEFPQLKYLTITRPERAEFFRRTVAFYKEAGVFPVEDVAEFEGTLDRYEAGELVKLWFSMAHNYNLAVAQSQGDVLMVLPSDYFCFFDATEIYRKYLEAKAGTGSFMGLLDWVAFGSLVPLPDVCGILREPKTHGETRRFTLQCLQDALAQNVARGKSQHGARIVDRETFDRVGGFDGRWFVRALPDDLFNRKVMDVIPSPYGLSDRPGFQDVVCFVGSVGVGDPVVKTYFHPRYLSSEYPHEACANMIRAFLEATA